MSAGVRPAKPIDTYLLELLFWETEKCNIVMNTLHNLKGRASPRVISGFDKAISLLRELRKAMAAFADLFPLYPRTILSCLNHLELALPAVSETLNKIQRQCPPHYPFTDSSWDRLLYVVAGGNRPGLELFDRLRLYTEFFDMLISALIPVPSRGCQFEWTKAESLRLEILDMREDDGMKVPQNPITPFVPFNRLAVTRTQSQYPLGDWAIETMDRESYRKSAFEMVWPRHSTVWGTYTPSSELANLEKSKLLFRRGFKNDHYSLTLFYDPNQVPYLLLRCRSGNIPKYECRVLSDVRIMRQGTTLLLIRWSDNQEKFVRWASLHHRFFEELVVTHCVLLAVKAQAEFGSNITHEECNLKDDDKIWERDIMDNGIRHKLALYRDSLTKTERLYACVARGERLREHAPAWTIFLTDQMKVNSQLECVHDSMLIVHDADVFTFGDRYRTARHDPRHFEIRFRFPRDNHELKWMLGASGRYVRKEVQRAYY